MGFVEIQTMQLTFSHFKFKLMLPENGLTCHSSLPKTSVNLGHFCFLIPCIDNCICTKKKNCRTCFLLLQQETVKVQINDFLLHSVFQVGSLTSTLQR